MQTIRIDKQEYEISDEVKWVDEQIILHLCGKSEDEYMVHYKHKKLGVFVRLQGVLTPLEECERFSTLAYCQCGG